MEPAVTAPLAPNPDAAALHKTVTALATMPRPESEWEFGVAGWTRSSGGGLKCVDVAEMDRQKGVLTHLLKTAGANLLQGKSAVNVSLPVRVFEPRSFLQRIPDAWCHAPVLLSRAALAGADPLERFKLVVAFAISGLHRSCKNLKPFNPILGETYQARFEDGAEVLLEQVSHHPPVSAFQVVGPGGSYHLHGQHEFAATFRPNSLVGQQIGPNRVSFPDGGEVRYELPYVIIAGTLMGERNFKWLGTMHFMDERSGLRLDLLFNPDAKGAVARFFSSQKSPCDAVRGSVVRTGEGGEGEEVVVSKCEGSWMDGISFDGQQYWGKNTLRAFDPQPVPEDEALPSDSRFRDDLRALLGGDETAAQEWKQRLEDRQRRDRALRKNALKARARAAKLERKRRGKAAAEEKDEVEEEEEESDDDNQL